MEKQKSATKGPSMERYLAWAREHCVRNVGDIKGPVISEAKGTVIKDVDGKEYLDFTSGQISATVGHSHPKMVEAIRRSAGRLIHLNSSLLSPEVIRLAKGLADLLPVPLKKVLFLTTGSESSEVALRMAKMHTGKYEVVGIQGGYHGHTGGAIAASYTKHRRGMGPLTPGSFALPMPYCYRCPLGMTFPSCNYACAKVGFEMVDTHSTGSLAAFIAEPILSSGGMVEPPPGYFQAVKRMTEERGMVFIMDEAQTGIGRTGSMFAFQEEGIVPDFLCLSKSLGGGIPISATVTSPAIEADVVRKGFGFRTSHMYEPLPAAVGLAILDIIKREDLVRAAKEKGAYLKRRLLELKEHYPIIGDVRGRGLFIGVELVKDPVTREPAFKEGREITRRCLEKGLWVDMAAGLASNVAWRIAPPLTVSYQELDRAVEIMAEAIQEVNPG